MTGLVVNPSATLGYAVLVSRPAGRSILKNTVDSHLNLARNPINAKEQEGSVVFFCCLVDIQPRPDPNQEGEYKKKPNESFQYGQLVHNPPCRVPPLALKLTPTFRLSSPFFGGACG